MERSRRSDPNFYSDNSRLEQTVDNYTAANLLCDTMGVNSVQKNVFLLPSIAG